MFLKIDHSSGVPIYRQIMEQVKYAVANGSLKPGDQLPSVRQLSLELKVNPNTIAKVISELEHSQVVQIRRGMGTFVSDKKIELTREVKMEIVAKLAERLAVEAVQVGLEEAEVREILNRTLARYYALVDEGEKA